MNLAHYIPFYKRLGLLAFPVVLSQIGQVTVSLVDTIMVGHAGTLELAAAAFANNVFVIGMYFGMGITYGLTPLVGKAYGNNESSEVLHWLKNGLFTHLMAGTGLTLIMLAVYFLLPFMGQEPEVMEQAKPYYLLLCASYLPFMLFFSMKQFFEGIGNTKLAMIITLTSNVVNVIANYLLIFGKLGFPEMGLIGAGIGTFVSRLAMPVMFLIFIRKSKKFRSVFTKAHALKLNRKRIFSLLNIGLPVGFQIIVETTTFSVGAVMMGWHGEIPLAAHQVAIGLSGFSYMISLGVSQATTIRVSHQLGQKDLKSLKMAVFASAHLVLLFMLLMGLIFISGRHLLPLIFTSDRAVIDIASKLLIVAAVFQIFDGLQVVMLSALRGLADVKIPMLIAFGAYMLVGVPVSYVSSFILESGPIGIWYGYLAGLGLAGILFSIRFKRNMEYI
ncbi:MAG TPA: MATE family efflux transporter [Mariniphaga sp.]|nr:MATE family efflux transporter [Mariniphaga sp.]